MTACGDCGSVTYNCNCTVQTVTVKVPSPTNVVIGTGQGGARGPQGIQGPSGGQGTLGTQGLQGTQGLTGVQGTQGVQGFTGSGLYTYSELPPENPQVGDRWVSTTNGYEYTWLEDLDSQQWVDTRTSGFLGPEGQPGVQGVQGIQGAEGPMGTGLNILGSYTTYEDLIAAHPTGNPGDAYLINGFLYVWGA